MEKTINIFKDHLKNELGDDFSPQTFNEMAKVLNTSLAKKYMIRIRYFQMTEVEGLNCTEALFDLEQEFEVSESIVRDAIYRKRKLD